jgi:hypothetical protein
MTASNGRCGRRGNSLSSYTHSSFVGILTKPGRVLCNPDCSLSASTPALCLTSIPLVVSTVTALHSLRSIELGRHTATGVVAWAKRFKYYDYTTVATIVGICVFHHPNQPEAICVLYILCEYQLTRATPQTEPSMTKTQMGERLSRAASVVQAKGPAKHRKSLLPSCFLRVHTCPTCSVHR